METFDQHKKWQNRWRAVLGLPINVKTNPDSDFDLLFGIWETDRKSFFKLFEGFPAGEMIARRAFNRRWETNASLTLSEQEILQHTQQAIENLYQIVPHPDLQSPHIQLIRGDENERMQAMMRTDPVSIFLDDEMFTIAEKGYGILGRQAYSFLIEPMYQLSTSYTPAHWILWPLANMPNSDPYGGLLTLYDAGCNVALGNNGVVIFQQLEK